MGPFEELTPLLRGIGTDTVLPDFGGCWGGFEPKRPLKALVIVLTIPLILYISMRIFCRILYLYSEE
jgi:hypothetical protein